MQKNKNWLVVISAVILVLSWFAINFYRTKKTLEIPNIAIQPTIILNESVESVEPEPTETIVDYQAPEETKEIILITEPEPIVEISAAPVPVVAEPIQACEYHLFFDIRHILLENSGSAAAKEVGVSNMFWYTVKHQKTPNHIEIQNRLFEFMDYCTQKPRGLALLNNELMPYLMCQWASGKITAQEIIDTLFNYKKEIKEFFVSTEEKNLVLGALNLLKPEVICRIQKPNNKMIHLFQKYCEALPDKVYILSNWDSESAELIYQKYPEIFDKINHDHIFFSSKIGKLKPEIAVFNYVTHHLKLKPQTCVLIDDSPENVRVAKSLGWKTVLHKDSETTTKELASLIYGEICNQNQNSNKPKSKKKKKTSKK